MSPSRSRQVRRAQARRAQKGGGRGSPPQPGGPGLLDRIPEVPPGRWLAAVAVVVVVVVVVVVLLASSSSSSPDSSLLTGSGYPNVNTSNTRYVGGPIDSSNVSTLRAAWTLPLSAKSEYGSYSAA